MSPDIAANEFPDAKPVCVDGVNVPETCPLALNTWTATAVVFDMSPRPIPVGVVGSVGDVVTGTLAPPQAARIVDTTIAKEVLIMCRSLYDRIINKNVVDGKFGFIHTFKPNRRSKTGVLENRVAARIINIS